MKKLLVLVATLLIPISSIAVEYGRFGPSVTSNVTQTIAAVGGAGSGGAMDRNCITNLAIDATNFPGASPCIFQVASSGSTLWSVAVSSTNPSIVAAFPPPPAPGTTGYGLCGNRGATVTITMTSGGCTVYDISSLGYVDR